MTDTPLAQIRAHADKEHLRSHCVSVRLSPTEYARLTAWATNERKQRGRLAREIILGAQPRVIPEINHARWEEHARTLSNLNQIAYHLNAGRLPGEIRLLLQSLLGEVHALRAELRGEEPTT
jgi:hypothetical protein